MELIDAAKAAALGAEPAGTAPIVVMPVSNAKAAAKGGWQSAGAVASGLLTLVVALWFEPSVGQLMKDLLRQHPQWVVGFAAANVLFGFVRNRINHAQPESRIAVVESEKA